MHSDVTQSNAGGVTQTHTRGGDSEAPKKQSFTMCSAFDDGEKPKTQKKRLALLAIVGLLHGDGESTLYQTRKQRACSRRKHVALARGWSLKA